jgi:excisionase family DNA binding protein
VNAWRKTVDVSEADQQPAVERIVFTPREVAVMLGKSKTTIYRWMDSGEIPYVQMGKDAQKLIPKALFLEKFGVRSTP